MVRTRIAPSPTGYPHIGTVYQALFDYAFANKNNGAFIVRIEDTDRNRFVADAEQKLFESLDWFGLTENESPRKKGSYGPYRQSERLKIYKKYALELITNDHAYYCFCTKERLEEVRNRMQKEEKIPMYDKHCRTLSKEDVENRLKNGEQWVIRLKVPKNITITVKDEIRGEISFDSNIIDDQVLLKSDGFPTYHLAVVVDDHLMQITHMVRGEEWIPSSPKHELLYEFFGWDKPFTFHTPILRNPDKSKLSKRQGHTSVSWYREQGYLPSAILNYLALMGWTHPDGKEKFSMDEFTKLFELKDIKAVAPIFDIHKLEWMNGEYIRELPVKNLQSRILEFYSDKKLPEEIVAKTIPLIRERIKKLSDYMPLCEFFFKKPGSYEQDLSSKKQLLSEIYDVLSKLEPWSVEEMNLKLVALAQKLKVKTGDFFMTLRVAITGKKRTPPLNESMVILGKNECLERVKIFV